MRSERRMAWGSCRDAEPTVVVALHTAKAPSMDDWGAWMAFMKAADEEHGGKLERMAVLVVTDGGGPDAVQREVWNKWLAGRTIRIAVLTNNLMVRGIGTAMSWFTNKIRIISAKNGAEALQFLDLPASRVSEIRTQFAALQRDMPAVKSLVEVIWSTEGGAHASTR